MAFLQQYLPFYLSGPPAPTTEPAKGISASKATLHGSVDPDNAATTYWFEYWKEGEEGKPAFAPMTKSGDAGEGSAPVAISERVEGLQKNTTYYFRLAASNENGEAKGEALSFFTLRVKASIVREPMPMDVLVLVTTPGGKTFDWTENGRQAGSILEEMTDSGSVPGGNKDWTATLPRKSGIDYSDLKRGSRAELFGAGQMPLGVYFLTRAAQISGDRISVTPAAPGYESRLVDDNTAQEIYIDADMTAWGDTSARRRAEITTNKYTNAQVQLLPAGSPDPENPSSYSRVPAISHSWTTISNEELKAPDVAESWYDSQGVSLGVVMLDFSPVTGISIGDTNWADQVYASIDGVVLQENLAELDAAVVTGKSMAVAEGRFHLLLRDYLATSRNETGKWETQWKNLRILGRHGIPVYGTWPAIGVLASDVVANALARWAPDIHFTTGANGTIKPTSFLIPHLAFKEPTTVGDMIQQATRFEIPEWGVWPGQFGPTFYMNPRGQREGRKRWRARSHEVEFEDTGQQLDQVFNGVVVQGQGTDGSTLFIGPAGSGLRYTSERLLDRDPQNPANEAGIKRYAKIQMKGIATLEGMIEAGEAFLEQSKLLDGSGKATLTGYVEDEHGMRWPYYCVEAGDEIEVVGSSIPGYRYIVNASRTRSSRSVSIDIDAPPDGFEAMMERLYAEYLGLALG
ncbi:MAG TPA: fibronectin type III domain-containing protein [Solirubrobacterales bacterium]|nr:fibronectin type III domain-containing protein [Solirubrobacterales bacterium]